MSNKNTQYAVFEVPNNKGFLVSVTHRREESNLTFYQGRDKIWVRNPRTCDPFSNMDSASIVVEELMKEDFEQSRGWRGIS